MLKKYKMIKEHCFVLGLNTAMYCNEHGILLYCIHANATHIMQPLDVGFFSVLKEKWKSAVNRYHWSSNGAGLTKHRFPAVFRQAWDAAFTQQLAISAFRRSGLFPFTVAAIDKSRLLMQPGQDKAKMAKMVAADGKKTPANPATSKG